MAFTGIVHIHTSTLSDLFQGLFLAIKQLGAEEAAGRRRRSAPEPGEQPLLQIVLFKVDRPFSSPSKFLKM